jgi:hypothetical protein
MTGIQIIEKQIADLTAACDLNRTRVEEIQREIGRLGYDLHVGGNKDAAVQVVTLRQERLRLGDHYETLLGAIDGLRERKAVAARRADLATAQGHRARAAHILAELEPLGAMLDRTIPHPDDGNPYSPADPQLQCKVAALTGALTTELRALRLADVVFPSHWAWDRASKADLAKALRETICRGWPRLAGQISQGEPTSIRFGERRSLDFVKILAVMPKEVHNNLAQHERANTEIAA